MKLDKLEKMQWQESHAKEGREHDKFIGDHQFDENELKREYFAQIHDNIDPTMIRFAKEHLVKGT